MRRGATALSAGLWALAAAGAGCEAVGCGGEPEPPEGMVYVPGGSFTMGSDDGLPEEAPAHPVRVSSFFLAKTEVTVAEFAAFVDETGYETDAERIGDGLVFDLEGGTWERREGADWRSPEGPGSSVDDRQDHPVVQVSHRDAEAYAEWAGARLPTEAEREYAARGGLPDATYPWGDELYPDGEHRANIWQGRFPLENTGDDGYVRTAPVGSFPPNDYGLYDMAGNVWEWTADWFSLYSDTDGERVDTDEEQVDPTGPERGAERVIRGGSWMCSEGFCTGYRVTARQANEPDASLSNLGFRLAKDAP